jgi:hypothetical protein
MTRQRTCQILDTTMSERLWEVLSEDLSEDPSLDQSEIHTDRKTDTVSGICMTESQPLRTNAKTLTSGRLQTTQ